jgi:pantetheine-phosphate adenylyltransferase
VAKAPQNQPSTESTNVAGGKNRRCVYAGSFDPLTNGHLWMIREGSRLFDDLVVAIGVHPEKRCTFSVEERSDMLKAALTGIANANVSAFSAHFLADYARQISANYILRGIRGESDYEYERGMRYVNDDLNPELTTIFLIPPRSMVEISSSMVKGLVGPAGWESVVADYVPAPVYRKVLDHELSGAFLRLWRDATGQAGDELYGEISERYCEPQRHYHTLTHISACLSELQQLSLTRVEQERIGLAIWFHDVIYDPLASDNEERSAEFFQGKATAAGMPLDLIQQVSSMIEATKNHEALPHPDGRATRLFIDIDLAILGASPVRFRAYDEAIRKEYASVPAVIYNPKRRHALRRFLDRQNVFCTSEFRERYERQARENLLSVVSHNGDGLHDGI